MIAYHMNMSRYKGEEQWLAKAKLLLERGADHYIETPSRGETPLHVTARWCKFCGKRARNYSVDVRETGALDLALLLAEYGAPLDARDNDGKLYYEAEVGERWDESWKQGMRPSEVKKAVEEAAEKGKGRLQSPSSAEQSMTKAEGKKRKR